MVEDIAEPDESDLLLEQALTPAVAAVSATATASARCIVLMMRFTSDAAAERPRYWVIRAAGQLPDSRNTGPRRGIRDGRPSRTGFVSDGRSEDFAERVRAVWSIGEKVFSSLAIQNRALYGFR
ncbi:hypothetical protein [Nocardia sp. NBC_00511]|uniref:hypothetical protein n=1 Tax=Nocardia sp. NBC_00511 TaxID=2903591 RepID=UPI0030DE31BB